MKHYKTIIRYLREYKEYLESSTYSLEYKRSHYSRTCGLVFGYIQAWNYNNRKERFTNNDIDLIYKYVDTLHNKYIMDELKRGI